MNIKKINLTDKSQLLDRLRGHVFHLTPLESYKEILEVGEISNNKTGCHKINTGSLKSYGRVHGCVCLFDLRNADHERVQHTLDCYDFRGPTWFSRHGRKYIYWDMVYLFLDSAYYNQIIPSSRVHDHCHETGEYLQAIPKTEVWIENKIPLSWIASVLIVRIKETGPDRNSPFGMRYWAMLKASE